MAKAIWIHYTLTEGRTTFFFLNRSNIRSSRITPLMTLGLISEYLLRLSTELKLIFRAKVDSALEKICCDLLQTSNHSVTSTLLLKAGYLQNRGLASTFKGPVICLCSHYALQLCCVVQPMGLPIIYSLP